MERQEEHLDLRQRKTRKLLVEALAHLLEEKPFQELSVTDICRRAMVHRTTFYAHFNDKQELLHYLLEGMERECAATCLPQDPDRSPREYLLTAARNVFQFFAQRLALYLSQQRSCHPGPHPGGLRRRGAVPSAVGAPVSCGLSPSGPPGGRPLLHRRYALPHPLVALQRRTSPYQLSAKKSGAIHPHSVRHSYAGKTYGKSYDQSGPLYC